MALGLLGGAFDPPHVGHLRLARAAIDQLELERLLVLVIEDPGHKSVSTPAGTRLELARLAFSAIPEAEVGLDRHERTVDSLEELRPVDAYFVIGADELADFWSWKRPERVLELVRLAVATRPGVPDDEVRTALQGIPSPDRVAFFEMEPTPVSSTEIRERVSRGESIEGLVSPEVAAAIARLGLYATAEYTELESKGRERPI
jgi:nicotinate-nucleotide adenylyltransferase